MAVLQIRSSQATQSVFEELGAFVASRRAAGKPAEDLEAFESKLHALFAAAEAEAMGEELARFDIDSPVVEIEGVTYRRVERCEKTYQAASGTVSVMRSLYRHGTERCVCPLELNAGIIEKYWTPLAAQQAAWSVAHLTPKEAASLFAKLGSMRPSRSILDRLPKELSARWEEHRQSFESKLRSEETVPAQAVTVAVSLDGVKIPVKDGEATAGKYWRGPCKFQEVGCATLSLYDADGDRLRTVRMARMPENYKKTVKAMLMDELEAVLSKRPDLQVVKVADAAIEPWNFLEHELPRGICIVDFYHAAEHLHKALEAAYGEGTPKCHEEFERLRHVLRHDRRGVDRLIRSLIYLRSRHPHSKKLRVELAFFRKNRHRMTYAATAAKNLPIGSGVVEAACKTLATQRLRRSGMRWRREGGQAILTLRGLAQSDRFDRGWSLLADTYRRQVALPGKVSALQSVRRGK